MVSQAYQQEVSLTYGLSCSLWFGQRLHGSPKMVIDFLPEMLSLPAKYWAYNLSVSFWDVRWNHRHKSYPFNETRNKEMPLFGIDCLKRKNHRLSFFIHWFARIVMRIIFVCIFQRKPFSMINQLLYPNALNLCALGCILMVKITL